MSVPPMKILVVVAGYTLTGVPLAQIRLARALADRGHQVDLMIGTTYPDSPVPKIPDLRVIELHKAGARQLIGPIWRYLRSSRPDVVFSAEDHLNGVVLLAAILARSSAKITGSSRVPPSDSYSNRFLSKGWINKQLLRAVMWRADVLTCVAEDMVESYREYFNPTPHICIHNIVADERSRQRMVETLEHDWLSADSEVPVIIAAGTFTQRKGFSDLIAAFAVAKAARKCRLIILGEGPLRDELEKQIDRLGLGDSVELPGNVENPLKYFYRADVIALTSYAEGLPNVLVEGMFCGCTPVATDCPTGPRELLQDGKHGYLAVVGDPASIAAALIRAIENPVSQELLTEAVERFTEESVLRAHFTSLGLAPAS